MSEFLYTVDGERVTLAEIRRRAIAKSPRLNARLILDRVNAGRRTWAELCANPVVGNKKNRRKFNRAGNRL